jgi:hypothetical protein
MQLHVHSDASYLSETKARSRAGGYFFLGSYDYNLDDESAPPPNGAIECASSVIPAVVASAAEAEYGALFMNGQTAAILRATLDAMGYPQHATTMVVDNECAVGLANNTVREKKSKAIDMRFHWIKDRVQQGQLAVVWKPGKYNLADFFTKAHPVHWHKKVRVKYVTCTKPSELARSEGVLDLATGQTWGTCQLDPTNG